MLRVICFTLIIIAIKNNSASTYITKFVYIKPAFIANIRRAPPASKFRPLCGFSVKTIQTIKSNKKAAETQNFAADFSLFNFNALINQDLP